MAKKKKERLKKTIAVTTLAGMLVGNVPPLVPNAVIVTEQKRPTVSSQFHSRGERPSEDSQRQSGGKNPPKPSQHQSRGKNPSKSSQRQSGGKNPPEPSPNQSYRHDMREVWRSRIAGSSNESSTVRDSTQQETRRSSQREVIGRPSDIVLSSAYSVRKESAELKDLKREKKQLNKQIKILQDENEQLKNCIFIQVSKVNDITNIQEIQSIPVSIYLDTNRKTEITKAYSAVLSFLASINFIPSIELKPVISSWLKKLIANSETAITRQEVTKRLKVTGYDEIKPQPKTNINNFEALVNITKSIENISNVVIQIDSLIVVKITNKNKEVYIQSRNLTIEELNLLYRKPELLTKPSEILTALAKEVSNENNKST